MDLFAGSFLLLINGEGIMGFFKKRKVEEIHVKIKEPKTKEPSKDVELYSEKINYVEETEFNIAQSLEDKLGIINREFNECLRKNDELTHSYYTMRIYSKIASKDREFNIKILDLDKQINRIRRNQEDLSYQLNNIANKELNNDTLEEFYHRITNYQDFQKEIDRRIKNINLRYFSHLKIATVNVTMNKTNKELDSLYQHLNLFLGDFKSLNEAAEYIFFNSGQLIISLVKSLINCFLDYGKEEYIKTYDFAYFLESDVIITLRLTEWIELYNKIKFVMKITIDADLINYLEFRNNFIQFELRYIILMMNMEGRKNSNIASFNI